MKFVRCRELTEAGVAGRAGRGRGCRIDRCGEGLPRASGDDERRRDGGRRVAALDRLGCCGGSTRDTWRAFAARAPLEPVTYDTSTRRMMSSLTGYSRVPSCRAGGPLSRGRPEVVMCRCRRSTPLGSWYTADDRGSCVVRLRVAAPARSGWAGSPPAATPGAVPATPAAVDAGTRRTSP